MSMDQIQHKFIQVRGLKLHIAEIGTGSTVVVFLHGFPEIWYSWRHQMIALADAGFRAIAPDFRGYGLSDKPAEPSKAQFSDLIIDLLGILDALNIPKVFLVAKDFGARPAFCFAIKHKERTLGIVSLGVPFMPSQRHTFPPGFYISRWQDRGRAEAEFGRFDAKTIVRIVYILFSKSDVPRAEENQEILDLVEPSTPLPPWLTEEDLAIYGALYDKSGFDTALKVPYRSINEDWGIEEPKIEVPTILIMGEKDYTLKFPKVDESIQSGKMKEYAPNLEIIYLPEGSHFVQEQFPKQVNELLLTFLAKNT